jgi:hypothetical protein
MRPVKFNKTKSGIAKIIGGSSRIDNTKEISEPPPMFRRATAYAAGIAMAIASNVERELAIKLFQRPLVIA